MNGEDQFERRLQRQAQRLIPPAWREEILNAARQAETSRLLASRAHRSLLSTIHAQLSTLLWPHPKAWAGLAAVWLLVLGLDFAAREPSRQQAAAQATPPSPQLRQLLQQQEQMLVELVGPFDHPGTNPRKPVLPQPRSQRREEFMNA
jgi:hypothetical protein